MTLNKTTIDASHDPMGNAISDYYKNGRAAHLRVLSSMFEEDELKAAGCRWSSNKKLWYWRHAEDANGWHRGKKYSMNNIRMKYGSQYFGTGSRAASLEAG